MRIKFDDGQSTGLNLKIRVTLKLSKPGFAKKPGFSLDRE